jgi:hypothetical protein
MSGLRQHVQLSRSAGEVWTSIEKITPEEARRILDHAKEHFLNRRIKWLKVKAWAECARNGEWVTGVPLIFDSDGVLIDGQHRLLALIEANTTLEFVCVWGMARKDVVTVDVGCQRSAFDFLQMKGHKNGTAAAAIARLILAVERCGECSVSTLGGSSYSVPPKAIVDRVDADETLRHVASVVHGCGLSHLLRSTGLTGWLLYCAEKGLTENRSVFQDFVEVVTGRRPAISVHDPAHILRERLFRVEYVTSKTPAIVRLALAVKAWNKFVRGEMMVAGRSLRFRAVGSDAESFPQMSLDVPVLAAGYRPEANGEEMATAAR